MATDYEIYTLHRYFIWANKMRTDLDNLLMSKQDMPKERLNFEANIYMSYWYAGLYVVIEGWRDLGLNDDTIDKLLDTPLVDLLRRFRNGVFHYQRDYFGKRFMDLINEQEKCISWIRNLNRKFGRYFLVWARRREEKRRKKERRIKKRKVEPSGSQIP